MDQDSFRQLINGSSKPSAASTLGAGSGSRAKLAVPQKQKAAEPSQPAFKPRKLTKPQDSRYRDRAAERRDGQGNDYAHVEAVLEDFEKKHADEDQDMIESQRKYLGGDSEHSVLVKGLDYALLQQHKAKITHMSKDDLDDLDQAFQEASSHVEPDAVPQNKKKTRQEILRELKQKRGEGNVEEPHPIEKNLEEVKQQGKFKPIGFKPIGSSLKKRKEGGDEDKKKKKKKRKVEESTNAGSSKATSSQQQEETTVQRATVPAVPEPEPQPVNDDFDIFADAGEYAGIDIDDDDETGDAPSKPTRDERETSEGQESSSSVPRRWFDDEPDPGPALPIKPTLNMSKPPAPSPAEPPSSRPEDEDIDMEEEQPMRLAGLESSKVPSIKDLLAMDEAAAQYEKKQKRKEKKKKKVKGDDDDD